MTLSNMYIVAILLLRINSAIQNCPGLGGVRDEEKKKASGKQREKVEEGYMWGTGGQ